MIVKNRIMRIQSIYPLSLGLVLLAALVAVAADAGADGQVIENTKDGYQLTCPDGLSSDKPRASRQKTVLVSARENDGDVFLESVAIALEAETADESTTDKQWEAFKASMERGHLKVSDVTDVKVGGLAAKRLIYSHPLKLGDTTLQIKAVMYFVVRGKQVWTIDGRGEERRFDWLQTKTDAVAKSVTWTK